MTNMKLPKDEYSKYEIEEMVELQARRKKMTKILLFLRGKKNIIQGIIATTSAFLAFKGLISPEDATYINAISLLIFGSASVATTQMMRDNN